MIYTFLNKNTNEVEEHTDTVRTRLCRSVDHQKEKTPGSQPDA